MKMKKSLKYFSVAFVGFYFISVSSTSAGPGLKLGKLDCSEGQVLKMHGGQWTCADTLENLQCSQDQVLRFDNTGWNCANDKITESNDDRSDTLKNIKCEEGDTLRFNNGEWKCSDAVDVLFKKTDNLQQQNTLGASAYVFVTSQTFDGNLGGVEGADYKCQEAADAAGLPGIYKAWIASNAQNGPASRFTRSVSAYILPPGPAEGALKVVAEDWTDLTTCDTSNICLQHPINITEHGDLVPVPSQAWTNVKVNGEAAGLDRDIDFHCMGWISLDPRDGSAGSVHKIDKNWTYGYNGHPLYACSIPKRLYCFGQ